MLLEPVPALSPGSVFHERYRIVRGVRTGGMGAVHEVVDLQTRRRRALKVMRAGDVSGPDFERRFRLEATIAAGIESEHVVEIFDAGVDPETECAFLVMELLRGEDLGDVLKRGPLAPEEVVRLIDQAAFAIDRTHVAGVVHRDLKPENVFVALRDDGSPKVKILDFGIAKVMAEGGQPAAATKALGTPLYMSPEQIRGDGAVDGRADLHALGHLTFALLTGAAYWEPESRQHSVYALASRIVAGCPEAASVRAAARGVELPPAFDAWFSRATRVLPEERFSRASDLARELARALDVPLARPRPWPSPPTPGAEPAAGAADETRALFEPPEARGSPEPPEPADTRSEAQDVRGPAPRRAGTWGKPVALVLAGAVPLAIVVGMASTASRPARDAEPPGWETASAALAPPSGTSAADTKGAAAAPETPALPPSASPSSAADGGPRARGAAATSRAQAAPQPQQTRPPAPVSAPAPLSTPRRTLD